MHKAIFRSVLVAAFACAMLATPARVDAQDASGDGAQVQDAVIAEINGEVVTYGELVGPITAAIVQSAETYKDDPEEFERQKRQLILGQYQRRKNEILLLTEALRRVNRNREARIDLLVEEFISELIAQAGSLVRLESQLDELGETLESKREARKQEILISLLFNEEIYRKINVSPAEERRYYREHPEEFEGETHAAFEHILLPFTDYEDEDAARTMAERLHERVAQGADFAKLAREYSKGFNAAAGGLWENVKPGGGFVTEVERIIFTLAPGQLGPVVRSRLGYHIVRVREVERARTVPFYEAQTEIRDEIWEGKFEERRTEYLGRLERQAHIIILWKPAMDSP